MFLGILYSIVSTIVFPVRIHLVVSSIDLCMVKTWPGNQQPPTLVLSRCTPMLHVKISFVAFLNLFTKHFPEVFRSPVGFHINVDNFKAA